MIDLRLGKWEDVLADFGGELPEVDALISDPPYGDRTHRTSRANDPRAFGNRADGSSSADLGPGYDYWTPADVASFVSTWSPRVRGWFVTMTSHDLIPAWEAAHEAAGRYCFAPLPCVLSGMSVRLRGDGPSSESVSLIVARPRSTEFASWGTLPGYYAGPRSSHSGGGRGKPVWIMREIVGHYTREGDTVVDPLAGWASTLIAARDLGRRSLGAEMDPATYTEALDRIAVGVRGRRAEQPDLFG